MLDLVQLRWPVDVARKTTRQMLSKQNEPTDTFPHLPTATSSPSPPVRTSAKIQGALTHPQTLYNAYAQTDLHQGKVKLIDFLSPSQIEHENESVVMGRRRLANRVASAAEDAFISQNELYNDFTTDCRDMNRSVHGTKMCCKSLCSTDVNGGRVVGKGMEGGEEAALTSSARSASSVQHHGNGKYVNGQRLWAEDRRASATR